MRLLFTLVLLVISAMVLHAQSGTVGGTSSADIRELFSPLPDDNAMQAKPVAPFNYKQTSEWNRFKLYRGLGIAAIGVGTISTFYSLLFIGSSTAGGNNADALSVGMISVSGAILLSSIPLFILANKNKKKALQMNVGVSALTIPEGNTLHTTPGLALAITF